jgi:ABC-type oligopeptide transport system ATPase subunit
MPPPLLDIRHLSVEYRRDGGRPFRAVDGVSLAVRAGESVGIVGESGCGKSTLARAVLGLEPAAEGEILFEGRPLAAFSRADWAAYRGAVQMIFQDSLGTLNPRMGVGAALREAIAFHRRATRGEESREVARLLDLVELPADLAERYPHELSGGQRQRVSIARALAVNPRLIVADEPVSALDVSIQANVIHLLERLRRELGVAFLFIAHDLAVVRALCPVAHVMHAGRVVESGPTAELFAHPTDPYTRALLDAVPDVRRGLSGRHFSRP